MFHIWMKTNLSLIRNKHFEILKGYRTARTRKPLKNKHDQEQMEEKLKIIEKKMFQIRISCNSWRKKWRKWMYVNLEAKIKSGRTCVSRKAAFPSTWRWRTCRPGCRWGWPRSWPWPKRPSMRTCWKKIKEKSLKNLNWKVWKKME